MDLAWISIAAFAVVITLSCVTTINVGVLAMAMALVVGVFLGGMAPNAVLEGFPVSPGRVTAPACGARARRSFAS